MSGSETDLPDEQTIQGAVVDSGERVEGATITVIDDTDSVYATTTTDEDGTFLVEIDSADIHREFQVVAQLPSGTVQLTAGMRPGGPDVDAPTISNYTVALTS